MLWKKSGGGGHVPPALRLLNTWMWQLIIHDDNVFWIFKYTFHVLYIWNDKTINNEYLIHYKPPACVFGPKMRPVISKFPWCIKNRCPHSLNESSLKCYFHALGIKSICSHWYAIYEEVFYIGGAYSQKMFLPGENIFRAKKVIDTFFHPWWVQKWIKCVSKFENDWGEDPPTQPLLPTDVIYY